MAVKEKVKSKKADAEVASLDPNDMPGGGLRDDFRGTIKGAVYCRWDYNGTLDEPVLAARLTILPRGEDGEFEDEPIIQHWSAGNLDSYVPSPDGKSPCPEPDEGVDDDDTVGPYAIKVGKRTGLSGNSNFAHLMSAILDIESKHFNREHLESSLACLEGLDAHWNRVPQKKRSGLQEAEPEGGERKRTRDVLVVTDVYGYRDEEKPGKKVKKADDAKAGKSKAAAKAKDEDADEADEGDDDDSGETNELDDQIAEAIVEAVAAADGKLKKSKLPAAILKAFAKDKNKAAAVKRVMEEEFLSGRDEWEFDEDDGTVAIE